MAVSKVIDIETIQEETKARISRLKEIKKGLEAIEKEKDKLDEQEAAFHAEAKDLGIDITSPSKLGGKRRGRPAGSGRGRGGSKTGETRADMLLRVMPNSEEDPVSKQVLVERLEKEGFTSVSDDPAIGVSQELTKMKKAGLASNSAGERGTWRLTKKGEKQAAKVAAARENADDKADDANPGDSQ